jgi:hypothetical protein
VIRILRQGGVRSTRERWYLWGVVKVVTHPGPLWDVRPWFAGDAEPETPEPVPNAWWEDSDVPGAASAATEAA